MSKEHLEYRKQFRGWPNLGSYEISVGIEDGDIAFLRKHNPLIYIGKDELPDLIEHLQFLLEELHNKEIKDA